MISTEKPATPEELVHYGVKGMRWGFRKREETITREPSKSKEKIPEEKSFRERHKKALIGAGVVAGILVAYGSYKLVDSGQAREFISAGKEFMGHGQSWKKNELLASKMDADGIMKNVVPKVNPKYGEIGTKNNCRRCTFAYEMRRRGMDVQTTRSISGTGQTAGGFVRAITPGSHEPTSKVGMLTKILRGGIREGDEIANTPLGRALQHPFGIEPILDKKSRWANSYSPLKKATTIFDALGKHPEGARGELGIGWRMGGRHSMAWEIIRGKPVIFDTQSGKAYKTIDELAKIADAIGDAGATRLDDMPLNNAFLRRWIQNVK